MLIGVISCCFSFAKWLMPCPTPETTSRRQLLKTCHCTSSFSIKMAARPLSAQAPQAMHNVDEQPSVSDLVYLAHIKNVDMTKHQKHSTVAEVHQRRLWLALQASFANPGAVVALAHQPVVTEAFLNAPPRHKARQLALAAQQRQQRIQRSQPMPPRKQGVLRSPQRNQGGLGLAAALGLSPPAPCQQGGPDAREKRTQPAVEALMNNDPSPQAPNLGQNDPGARRNKLLKGRSAVSAGAVHSASLASERQETPRPNHKYPRPLHLLRHARYHAQHRDHRHSRPQHAKPTHTPHPDRRPTRTHYCHRMHGKS